ncbi:MAG: hypothetical protein PHW60_03060 [Kiritimatiellae bacterium]|nr:hypothetical protein [Kiritimatiellia bacterium]
MMPETKRSVFVDLFVPRYDELSLFLMSASFFLVVFLDPELKALVYKALVAEFDPRLFPFYAVFLLFISGAALSIYHVFTKARKKNFEKFAMLYFAVMVNGLIGFLAGAQMLQTSHGYLLVFPVWNILNSLLLLLMYRFSLIDETAITDDNAAPYQVALGGAVVLAVFLVCQYVFRLHWTITFSVCVCYATNANSLLQRLLSTRRENPIDQNR